MDKSVTSQPDKDTTPSDHSDINYLSTTSDVYYETRSASSSEPEPSKDDLYDQLNRSDLRREATPEEKANQPDPILFAKLTGSQELIMRIKHSEESPGPKVDLQLTLGSLVVFFSPRQLHTLIELADGLSQPDLEDTR